MKGKTPPCLAGWCSNDCRFSLYRFPHDYSRAVLSAIEFAIKKCVIILGMPSHYSCQALQKHFGCQTQEMCMIGDHLDKDMPFTKSNGFPAFLMLTGMTAEADIKRHQGQLYQKEFHDLDDGYLYRPQTLRTPRHDAKCP